MKRAHRAVLLLAAALPLAAVFATADQHADEAAAIEAVIESAYIGGMWMHGDEEAARAGFHPSFVMQRAHDEGVMSVSLDAWLERLNLHGEPLMEGITYEIEVLDQTGGAAAAKVLVFQNGEPLYTDYMSLYKIDGGWKIVAKTYHSHK